MGFETQAETQIHIEEKDPDAIVCLLTVPLTIFVILDFANWKAY